MRLSTIHTPDRLMLMIEQSIGTTTYHQHRSLPDPNAETYKHVGPTQKDNGRQQRPHKTVTAKELHDNAPRTSTESRDQQTIDDEFLAKKDVKLWSELVSRAKDIASSISSSGQNKLQNAANVIRSILTIASPPGKRWKMRLKEAVEPRTSISDFVGLLTKTGISPYTMGIALHAFIKGIIKSSGLSVGQVVNYMNNAYGGNKNAQPKQNADIKTQPAKA